jgi:hypothetical protein
MLDSVVAERTDNQFAAPIRRIRPRQRLAAVGAGRMKGKAPLPLRATGALTTNSLPPFGE